jgi:hypothetical protein
LTLSSGIYTGTNTVSNACLNYISTLSSNAQTQLTSLQTQLTTLQIKTTNISYGTFTLISGTCQTTTLNCNGNTQFKGATSIVAGHTFTFLGNISANSNTITPTQLGYISGLSSNAQAQLTSQLSSITTLQTLTSNISYSSGLTTISLGDNNLFISSNTYPTTTSMNSGMCVFWNSISPGSGNSDILNYAKLGLGGFTFNNCSAYYTPKTLLSIDSSGNTSQLGNVVISSSKYIDLTACTGTSSGLKIGTSTYLNATQLASLSSTSSLPITYTSPDTTINSNIQVNGLIKTSTTALTYTSTAIGYSTSVSNSTDFTITASSYIFSYTSPLTLGIGVWLLFGTVQLYNTSTATITRFVQFSYTSGSIVNGSQNSCNDVMTANVAYCTPANTCVITITTAATQINMAYAASVSNYHQNYYYFEARRIC